MLDPQSIALGAAIGTIAGQFSKEAFDLGKNWIRSYFKDHNPKAIETAEQNSLDFLGQLAQRVKTLEDQGEQQKKVIADSLVQPDFSILLQKAILSSAQTADREKHGMLARLVAERLTQDAESVSVLCNRQAVDVIAMLNSRQMRILGFLTTVWFLRPEPVQGSDSTIHRRLIRDLYSDWLQRKLSVYQDLAVHAIDFLHLESLSCVKWDRFVSRDIVEVLSKKIDIHFRFNADAFLKTTVGRKTTALWDAGLKSTLPTSVGLVIGVYTSDRLHGSETSLNGFGELRIA